MTTSRSDPNRGRLAVGFPKTVWLLVLAVAIVGSNSLVIGPIAPGIATDLSSAIDRVLYASAAYGLGTAVSALLLARWIDRLGLVKMLRLAFLVFLIAFVACALSVSVWMLVLAQILAGLAAGVALPAIYAFAARLADVGDESRVLGTVLTGWTLSMVAGVSFSAWLAELIIWRAVFLALATPVILLLATLFMIRDEAPVAEVAPSPFIALKVPGIMRLLVFVSLYMLSFYGTYSYVGDHIVSTLGLSLVANAWLAASYGCGFGLAALFGTVIDRFGSARATPAVLLLLALVYLFLALVAQSYWWLLGAAFIWGLINHLGINVLIAQLSAIDPARRGTILGLYSSITYFCMFVATLVFGWIYPLLGWQPLAVAAAAMCLLAAFGSRSGELL